MLSERSAALLWNDLLQGARLLRHEVLPESDVALRVVARAEGLLSKVTRDRKRYGLHLLSSWDAIVRGGQSLLSANIAAVLPSGR